jgi:hypothetical protein
MVPAEEDQSHLDPENSNIRTPAYCYLQECVILVIVTKLGIPHNAICIESSITGRCTYILSFFDPGLVYRHKIGAFLRELGLDKHTPGWWLGGDRSWKVVDPNTKSRRKGVSKKSKSMNSSKKVAKAKVTSTA